jgi:hypothetical protein
LIFDLLFLLVIVASILLEAWALREVARKLDNIERLLRNMGARWARWG